MSYVLKPGSYYKKTVGIKPNGLELDSAIGQFLVSKGLATTTDCCTYTLDCGGCGGGGAVSSVTATFNALTDVITITVDGVTANVGIAITSNSILTNAALTVAGTVYPAGTSINTILAGLSAGVTNLGYTASPTNGIVTSDTGTDATLPLVTGINAGLATPTMFTNSHVPATVTDSGSVNLTITGQDITAIIAGADTATVGQIPTSNGAGGLTWATGGSESTTVTDTSSINLTLTGNAISADVILNPANAGLIITPTGLLFDTDGASTYNNLVSGITATTIQDAIDFLAARTNVDNGLSIGADSKIELGGTLHQNTTINNSTFSLTNSGTSGANTYSRVSGAAVAPIQDILMVGTTEVASRFNVPTQSLRESVTVSATEVYELSLNGTLQTATLAAGDPLTARTFTVSPTQHFLDNLASGYQDNIVYYNSTTGEITYRDIFQLPAVGQMYDSDADAAVGGIALNKPYWAGPAHVEGAIHGTPKLRIV